MVLIRRSFGMLYQFLYKSIFGNFIENISPEWYHETRKTQKIKIPGC